MHVWVVEARLTAAESWHVYLCFPKRGAARFYRRRLKENGRETRIRKYVPQDGGRSVPAGEKP